MKKQNILTQTKSWVKDYYGYMMADAKTSKIMNAYSWVLMAGCAGLMFATLSSFGAGLPSFLASIVVALEGCDCAINFSKGNTSSYFARATMAVAYTLLMPVAGVADFIKNKVEEVKEAKAEKVQEENFKKFVDDVAESNNTCEKEFDETKDRLSCRQIFNTEEVSTTSDCDNENLNVENNTDTSTNSMDAKEGM